MAKLTLSNGEQTSKEDYPPNKRYQPPYERRLSSPQRYKRTQFLLPP